MNETYRYVVNGDPIPLLRARYGRRSIYDSQKNIKLIWSIELQKQHNQKPMLVGQPLHLDVFFYMPIPQNLTPSRRESYKKRYHIFKPDLSNLIKFIEDCATGIVYHDDCLISSISAQKLYDHDTRTEVIITPIGNKPNFETESREVKRFIPNLERLI